MSRAIRQRVGHIVERVCRKLPQQNPLQYFLHSNLLMAFEDQPFWEGVHVAAALYGGNPTKSVRWYHRKWLEGIITEKCWQPILAEEFRCSPELTAKLTPSECRHLSQFLLRLVTIGPHLPWQNLCRMTRPDYVVPQTFHRVPHEPAAAQWPLDVFEWICHLLETLLDQGIARWRQQNKNLLSFACDTLQATKFWHKPWQKALYQDLRTSDLDAREILEGSIENSGKSDDWWEFRLLQLTFSLRGWSGMVHKLATEPQYFTYKPEVKIHDLLVLLIKLGDICDPFIHSTLESKSFDGGTLPHPHSPTLNSPESHVEFAAMEVQEAWGRAVSPTLLTAAQHFIRQWDSFKTPKLWHEAFETAHYGALVHRLTHVDIGADDSVDQKPKTLGNVRSLDASVDTSQDALSQVNDFQIFVCIDDREESLRRHLEVEIPRCQTYGVLGHFALDMSLVSAHHGRPKQQCPPVVKPRRVLIEVFSKAEVKRQPTVLQQLSAHHFHSSKSILGGAASALLVGNATLMPLFVKSMVPPLLHRVHFKWSRALLMRGAALHRTFNLRRYDDPDYGPCGYTYREQAEIVATVLKQAGTANTQLAPVVIAMGHESTTTNNPFSQAYGCGACSGNSGAANARVFAMMFNHPETRTHLKEFGIHLDPNTVCIAAVHDTSREMIALFDDDVPLQTAHQEKIAHLKKAFHKALARNAEERAPLLGMALKSHPNGEGKVAQGRLPRLRRSNHILQQIADRPLDLAQNRPEFGHSRTHFALIGKRSSTQAVSFERRSFLVSYDQDADCNGEVLTGLLHGGLPVVANITLDYFFSSLDPQGFGSNNKVPLNVSAMLGVIQGSRGDLQVGLAQQMVEIHDPVRGLALIEAPREWILAAINSHPRLANLVNHQWLKIGQFDVQTNKVWLLNRGGWHEFSAKKGDFPDLSQCYSLELSNKKRVL